MTTCGSPVRRSPPRRSRGSESEEVLLLPAAARLPLDRAPARPSGSESGATPPRCAILRRLAPHRTPAGATFRFLQTLEASKAAQTFVMNDLSAMLPSLTVRGAKPFTTEPGETRTKTVIGKRKAPAKIRLRLGICS